MKEITVDTNFAPTPVVTLTNKDGKPGASLTGKLVSEAREVKGNFGPQFVLNFELIETNAPTTVKGKDVEVGKGDKVAVFASKSMMVKLGKVKVGQVTKISYQGKEKGDKGFAFHKLKVEVE